MVAAFDDLQAGVTDKVESHEASAHEVRRWVRLTNLCNNKCTFCLDSAVHNGTYVDKGDIERQITEGPNEGATRLILSGGEPTIHPDYIHFIKVGRKAGYRRIQTVTNGRMFSYPQFLKRCVNAGLQEITFSVHGHNAKVHDALVGVKGAYEEIIAGIRNAFADGRVIVNVDVCLNRANVQHLPELLEGLMAIGVREFDLLHIIPFGDAYRWGKDTLFYEVEEAYEPIRYALELSKRPDMHIWFNRFPPPFLEGFEHLIQDPHKLTDEVRGRYEEYDWWVRHRWPLLCRQPDRCTKCYLQQLCDGFERTLASVAGRAWDVVKVYGASVKSGAVPEGAQAGVAWVVASDIAEALPLLDGLPGDRLWLELASWDGALAHLDAGRLGGRRLERAYVTRAEDLDALLAADFDFEVTASLVREVAARLTERYAGTAPARLSLRQPTWDRLTEARARDVQLPEFFAQFTDAVPVEGVPRCLLGRAPREGGSVLDTRAVGPEGAVDVYGYTDHFILEGFYTKSRRCSSCVFDAQCRGAHVNWVRAHGYAQLNPVVGE